MAAPMPSESRAMQLKAPLADSSNRTPLASKPKRHTHLRSSSTSSIRKSPPTCTVSLASVTTSPAVSFLFPTTNLPLSPSVVPFPSDADASCGDPIAAPEPWRRPRARTSHVETPRRAQPPKPRAARISKHTPRATPITSLSGSDATLTKLLAPTPADLRLAALLARSIAANLARHADDDPDSSLSLSDLEQQDLLLCERLQALLALHGRRVRPASPPPMPTGIVPPACAPSVLLSGSAGVDPSLSTALLPLSPSPSPSAAPPPRFITTTRARSGSRGSAGTAAALEMPALVATLLFRRHEGVRQTGTGTRTPFVRRPSKLSTCQS